MASGDDEIIDVVNTDEIIDVVNTDDDMDTADDDGGDDVEEQTLVCHEQATSSSSDSSVFHNYGEIEINDDNEKKTDDIVARNAKFYKSVPNILSRKGRKRKFSGNVVATSGRRKDDPEVKERVLQILKVAQTKMSEEPKKAEPVVHAPVQPPKVKPPPPPPARRRAPFGQLRIQLRKKRAETPRASSSSPEPASIKLKAIEKFQRNPGDDMDISRALSQISHVEMSCNKIGERGGKQCFVISDKLRRMISEFKSIITATISAELPKKLKSHHLDLLAEIEEQCSEECDTTREKFWIMEHLGNFCGIHPVALMNRILRRRQELREEAAYLDRVMGIFDTSLDKSTKEIEGKGDGVTIPTNVTLSELGELRKPNRKEKSPSPEKKNMSISVPRPKYLIYNPKGRVFKLTPGKSNKLEELSKFKNKGEDDEEEKNDKEEEAKEEPEAEKEDRAPELEPVVPLPSEKKRMEEGEEKKEKENAPELEPVVPLPSEKKRMEEGDEKKEKENKKEDTPESEKKEAEEEDHETPRSPSASPKKTGSSTANKKAVASTSTSASDESPKKTTATCHLKPRKIVRRIRSSPEPPTRTRDPVAPSVKMCLKMKLDVSRNVIANENRFAILAIKRRIDDRRLERSKLLMHQGRIAEKIGHIEHSAITTFLTRMSTWPRQSALDAHTARIRQFKALKVQRDNLTERINKIDEDIEKLLTVDLQLFVP